MIVHYAVFILVIKKMGMGEDFMNDFFEEDREAEWDKGFHTTRDGRTIAISSMTTRHLKNTIQYFEDSYDVTTLQLHIKSRCA